MARIHGRTLEAIGDMRWIVEARVVYECCVIDTDALR